MQNVFYYSEYQEYLDRKKQTWRHLAVKAVATIAVAFLFAQAALHVLAQMPMMSR